MSKNVHPAILFLGKFSLALITLILLAYIYALVVARTEFSRPMFTLFLSLAIIALGLIIKGVYQSKFAKGQSDTENEKQQR